MPPDRSTAANNGGRPPPMPCLSAGAARVVNRTPLMPKIASKAAPQAPLVATTAPTTRRISRPTPSNSGRGTPVPHTAHHDEHSASLAPPFLANVTPRPGSRQARVNSASSTPSGTPSGTPSRERFEGGDRKSSSGQTSPRLSVDHAKRPTVSFGSVLLDPKSQAGLGIQQTSESKFFHASDVQLSRAPSAAKQTQARPPTLFPAKGITAESRSNSPIHPMPTASQSQQDNVSSKFVYANGAPEVRPSLSPPASLVPGSAASKPPRNRPSLGSQSSESHLGAAPSSPAKSPSQPVQPPSKSRPYPPQRNQPPLLSGSATDKLTRRKSSGASRVGTHSRKSSLVLSDLGAPAPPPKLMSPLFPSGPSSPLHTPSTPAPLTLASIIQAAEELPDDEEASSADGSRSEVHNQVHSPAKSNAADPISELVSNARRERKVQDLQITNASLEAINRTLERQLRKQTAELRRYKRMSRAGGLAMASAAATTQETSEAAPTEQVGLRIVDLSEGESDNRDELEVQDEPEEESLSETESDLENLTPNQVAEHDAKHRTRDEARLKLDLTKHQQLLVDSQKINQSIKRCLNWTEELIKDGKKALAYSVKLHDVKLGGRVLSPLDEPDEQEEFPRLEEEDDDVDDMIKFEEPASEPAERISDWSIEPRDRDSGIEMPSDGG
ncbi:hypothetical protein DL764_006049 [Monosporascus ibericus]|uniref:Uncharacterized protein n=1 Tax=Monosporascus ibericus TaxID=155417 RepID=A0A4Q4T652_9PEZI|nr:hypothetical protein DL764_006049 [Monosporascus ibericus]